MTKSPKFSFIKARWHSDIVDQSYVGFVAQLKELGVDAEVETFDVPGAFEMPLRAQKLAATGAYDAVIAAALVVDDGIYRHDFVAQVAVDGLMKAGMDTGVPVLSVSLTPHHFQPSQEHEAYFHAHFVKKGVEAANAAVQITNTHAALNAVADRAAA